MMYCKVRQHILAVSTLLLAAGGLTAQDPVVESQQTAASVVAVDSAVLGARRGTEAARYESTTNWIWGGFLGGATLGPIGAGLAWTLANNSEVSLGVDRRMLLSYDGGFVYIDAYERAYAEALFARRKRSALIGGAIGTAALAAAVTTVWAIYYYY